MKVKFKNYSLLTYVVLTFCACSLIVLHHSKVLADENVEHYKSWSIHTVIDDFTDEQRPILVAGDGKNQNEAILIIKCDKRNDYPYVVILLKNYISSHDTREITYRLDKKKPKTISMSVQGKKLMILHDYWARFFLMEIRGATSLIGRTHDYENNTVDFKISVDGYNTVEERLYTYCKPR